MCLNTLPKHCEKCDLKKVEKNDDVNSLYYNKKLWICSKSEDICPEHWKKCPFIMEEDSWVIDLLYFCTDCDDFYNCHFNEIPDVNFSKLYTCIKNI